MEETLRFVLPSLPKSMNAIYGINFAQRRVYLKDDVALWKSESKSLIPSWRPKEMRTGLLRVDAAYTYNFYYQNGKLREVDTANMLKVLYDLISEKIGVDDKFLKAGSFTSTHSDKVERVEVEVRFV